MLTIDFEFTYEELGITQKDLIEICPEETVGIEDFADVFGEIMDKGNSFIKACGGYSIIDNIIYNEDSISIDGIDFQTGRIIAKQMKNAEKVVIFACTAGPGIRIAYDRYMTEGDPLKAFFADTLGTVAVEKAMDIIHESIKHSFKTLEFHCTNRYSPGYCGWSVGEQQKLWKFLPRNYCGISLTESSLMLPIKSVSGIIGIGKSSRKSPYSCSICELESCIYRRKKIS